MQKGYKPALGPARKGVPVCPSRAPRASTGAVEGGRLTINSINQEVAAGDAADGGGAAPCQVLPTVAALPQEGRASNSSRTGVQSSAHTGEGLLPHPHPCHTSPFWGAEADGHPLLLSGLCSPSSLQLPVPAPHIPRTKICQQPGLTPSFPKSRSATPGGGPDEALRPHSPRLST